MREGLNDPLDGVDPNKYLDALPAVMDRMKAANRADFDEAVRNGDINSGNKHEWAESIVIANVDKFLHPLQIQLVEWGDVESKAFPELMTDLILYADELF